jgi:peptidoglycan hydrolase-like protein with peptidoglycan-binding domain
MYDPLVESLAKIRLLESKEILNEFTAPPALKAGGKFLGKALPGVGLALAAQDAYSRQQAGDTTGAAISAATGAASSIPVVGTAASLIGTGVQAIRDKMRTGSWMPDEQEIATAVAKDGTAQPAAAAPATAVAQAKPAAAPTTPAPPGADPKVLALQKQLIAKGAKITADGKMGPATQAAMKQFPGTAVAEQFKGTTMSEAQKIAELRDRLAQFESQAQVTDEGWGTAAKGVKDFGSKTVGAAADAVGSAWGAAKNFVGGVGKGIANPAATNLKNVAAGTTASTKGIKTGAAVARNPGKVAVGAAAAGAGTMAALGGGAAAHKPTAPKPAAPAAAPAPVETPNAAADPAEVAELNAMAAELENSQDPADIEMMKRYNGLINAINNGAAGDKRTAGQQAANADLAAAGT